MNALMTLEEVRAAIPSPEDCPHPFEDITLELTRGDRTVLLCFECLHRVVLPRRCPCCREELYFAAWAPGFGLFRCHRGHEFRSVRVHSLPERRVA